MIANSCSDVSSKFSVRNAKPKVTVCVVTYNQKDFIAQCLQSLVDQKTEFPFEILVADDCSVDGTSEIVLEFSKKLPNLIKHYRHSKNVGPYKNYIFVHGLAVGEYIAHIDGDDKWEPQKIGFQSKFLNENPDCVAVYTNASVIDESGRKLGVFNNSQPEKIGLDYLTKYGNFLFHSSMMYRSIARGVIDNLPERFIDYNIHIKLANIGYLGYINKTLGCYRYNVSNSLSSKKEGDEIRPLYWSAINGILLLDLSDKIKTDAIGNFLGKTIIFYFRTRQIKKIFDWWGIVTYSSPNYLHHSIFMKAIATIIHLGILKITRGRKKQSKINVFFLR